MCLARLQVQVKRRMSTGPGQPISWNINTGIERERGEGRGERGEGRGERGEGRGERGERRGERGRGERWHRGGRGGDTDVYFNYVDSTVEHDKNGKVLKYIYIQKNVRTRGGEGKRSGRRGEEGERVLKICLGYSGDLG